MILLALLAFWLWTPDRDRAALEALYLQSPADMVQVAGQRLHVRDSGPRDAPAVVLIHGFGASLHTWEPWAKALARTHRVVRFDLPGSGLSDPDPQGDYRDARTMELLLALMDTLGIPQADVVGTRSAAAWPGPSPPTMAHGCAGWCCCHPTDSPAPASPMARSPTYPQRCP